jgi:hypothetical protein
MNEQLVQRAHFPEPLEGEFLGNGRMLRLTEDFTFITKDGETIEVPKGFITDFNSVPRGLWNVFPPWEYPEAGVVHDWLYRHPAGKSRGEVDSLHRQILDLLGAPWWKRQAAWSALRVGGRFSWSRYREQEAPSDHES